MFSISEYNKTAVSLEKLRLIESTSNLALNKSKIQNLFECMYFD